MFTTITLITVAFLLVVIFLVYKFFYIPPALQPLAEIAGFKKISISYQKMKAQKIPVDFLFQQYVKATEVKVALFFDDLKDYYLTYPKKTENMVNVLIKAKRAGLKININELERFEISGGNPERLVNALKTIQNAGLDISRNILEIHSLYGGNINTFVEIILRAKKAHLELDIQSLVEENLSDDDMKKIVNILIRAQKSNLYVSGEELKNLNENSSDITSEMDLRISQKGILEHFRANIDIEKYTRAMIRAKKSGLKINENALNIHYLTDGDIEKLVETMIKVERSHLEITQTELVQHNIEGRDIGTIIDSIIKANQVKLDISIDNLIDFHRLGGKPEQIIKAMIISKKSDLNVGREELEKHFLAGANIIEYVNSMNFIKNNQKLGITKNDIDNHYLKGGNILKTLSAISYANKNNVPIIPAVAFALDLVPTFDIDKIVQWAVNPQIMDVKPAVAIVAKDGIQISPKMRVTVRGKINLYTKGSKEEVLFGRINEAVAEEIPKYDSYKSILKNLNKISDDVLKRVLGKVQSDSVTARNKLEREVLVNEQNEKEKKLNESSAYEILDIKIYDIMIGKDILASHKLHYAEHEKKLAEIHLRERMANAQAEEAESRAKLTAAKIKVQEGMAEAFLKGGFNFKNYQKEKHIFETFDDDINSNSFND